MPVGEKIDAQSLKALSQGPEQSPAVSDREEQLRQLLTLLPPGLRDLRLFLVLVPSVDNPSCLHYEVPQIGELAEQLATWLDEPEEGDHAYGFIGWRLMFTRGPRPHLIYGDQRIPLFDQTAEDQEELAEDGALSPRVYDSELEDEDAFGGAEDSELLEEDEFDEELEDDPEDFD